MHTVVSMDPQSKDYEYEIVMINGNGSDEDDLVLTIAIAFQKSMHEMHLVVSMDQELIMNMKLWWKL